MWLFALLACAPEPVPTHDTLPLAEEIAAAGVARWPDGEWSFDWIPTVWAYGLHRLHVATGDPTWQEPYREWLVDNAAPYAADPPLAFNGSDSMSPALLASVLLSEDPSAVEVDPIVDAAELWLAEAPRTDEGAIEHWGESAPFGIPGQVWIDSQFMFGLFLLKEYDRTYDVRDIDVFVAQYGLFSELCRDDASELYRHAYDDATDANIPTEAAYWARGNSWVLVAAAEALAQEGAVSLPPVSGAFVAHAEAVAALQDEDGLWHTVLNEPNGDDPENYTETSASALIAYAFAVGLRAGVLDPETFVPVVDRAVAGIVARIDRDDEGLPVVEGTSYGTNPGDYDYYVGVGRHDDLMLGVGAVVMLLAEVHGTERPAESP